MALTLKNMVQCKTNKTGNGANYACGAAVTDSDGFTYVLPSAAFTDGQKTLLRVKGPPNLWEVFVARYESASNRFVRTQLLSSSTGSAISWSTGVKNITAAVVAERQVRAGSGCTVTDDETTGEQVIDLEVDIAELLIDVIDDGYGVNWNVTEDSLGTHFQPDRIVSRSTDSYASEIEIDLAKSPGEWHRFVLAGNPTLLVTNFEHNDPGEPGKKFVLEVVQDSAGGRAINFAGSDQTWTFPDGEPALTTIPNGVDYLEFLVVDVETPEFLFLRPIHRPRTSSLIATPFGLGAATAYWKMDEASGTRADEIASYDLTSSGATSTTGIISSAAVVGGGNTLEHSGHTNLRENGTGECSLWFWLKLPAEAGFTGNNEWTVFHGNFRIYVRRTAGGQFSLRVNHPQWSADELAIVLRDAASGITPDDFGDWMLVALSGINAGATTYFTLHLYRGNGDHASNTFGKTATGYGTGSNPFRFGSAHSGGSLGSLANTLVDEVGWISGYGVTADDVAAAYNSGSGVTTPLPISKRITLDWRYELNRSVADADGDFQIASGTAQPGQTMRLAVENDGATGTLTLNGVDFGDEGDPSLPADGTFDLYELTAIDATTIIGRTIQTGLAP